MGKLTAKIHRRIVRMGWGLYRASIALKDFGENKRIDLLIALGKLARRCCMIFPAK